RTEAVVAALVHDLGMTAMPPDLLAQPTPFTDDQRRALEQHCHDGSRWLAKLWPARSLPVRAAVEHHEQPDGMGHPAGRRGDQLDSSIRLLSACDIYVGMTSPRPHRPAHDPRTALADTLLQADRGALDKQEAEKLLRLGFYPVGCLVELDDGALAHVGRQNPTQPAKTLVALVTSSKRQPLLNARVLDLSDEGERGILRQAPEADRRKVQLNAWSRAL